MTTKTIISLSAQDTAKWFSGEEPVDWMEGLRDPAQLAAYHAHKARMAQATQEAVKVFAAALPDSEPIQQRLLELAEAARGGDATAANYTLAMLMTLMRTGLGLGAL
jgi:hypothetical protein